MPRVQYLVNMKHTRLFYVLITLLSLTVVSCKKDDDEPGNGGNNGGGGGGNTTYAPGTVKLEFSNYANGHGVNFSTNTWPYGNNLGQGFNVSEFRYYVSNIVLIKDDATEHAVSDVYHLVDEPTNATRIITIPNVPGGKYTSVRFMLGVDPARVAAGNFTGDLDASKGMFIDNTNGFMTVELSGRAKASPDPDSLFTYRIGGLGANNTTKTITCSFNGQTLIVDGTRNAQVHLVAEILEMLKTPTDVNFSTTYSITAPGPDAVMMANNYADMFRFDHIHN